MTNNNYNKKEIESIKTVLDMGFQLSKNGGIVICNGVCDDYEVKEYGELSGKTFMSLKRALNEFDKQEELATF